MQQDLVEWDEAVDVVAATCKQNVRRWGALPDLLEIDDVVSSVYLLITEEFGVNPTAAIVRRDIVLDATSLFLKRTRDAAWRRRQRRPVTQQLSEIDRSATPKPHLRADILALDFSESEAKLLENLWECGNLTTLELGERLGVPHQRASELKRAVKRKIEKYFQL